MNKNIIYLFIFVLLVSFPKDAPANTDILNNVLNTINSTLKEVGEVQNKISGKVRQILSIKISPEALIGAIGGKAALDKARKLQEMGENLKEKADKALEVAETAKEKKEEYMQKYQELNAAATEKFAEANAAFNEYKTKMEEYKTKAKEYMEMGKEVIAVGTAAYGAVSGVVGAVKGGAESGNISDMASALGMENVSNAVKGVENQSKLFDGKKAEMTEIKQENITEIPSASRADVISSVSALADQSMTNTQEAIKVPNTNVLEAKQVDISSQDIMNNIAEQKLRPQVANEEIKTDVNIKDQLTNSSNKVLDANQAEQIQNIELKEIEKQQEMRVKFGEATDKTVADKAEELLAKDKIEAMLADKQLKEKEVSLSVKEKAKAAAEKAQKEADKKGFKEKAKAEKAKSKAEDILAKAKQSATKDKLSAEKEKMKKQQKAQEVLQKAKEKMNAK